MQKTYSIQSKSDIKDTSKGQKIVAALYLVTNHLTDSDPLKVAIRTHAIALIDSTHDTTTTIIDLLTAALYAHLISEQNVAVLVREITRFKATPPALFGSLFDTPEGQSLGQVRTAPRMSLMSDRVSPKKSDIVYESKNKRQGDILSFINDRKSAGIKDIAALFPDVSEKTIQRELGALVDSGQITKRGSKRWSIYLSVRP